MKTIFDGLLWLVLLGTFSLAAQGPAHLPKFYPGASYGTSFSLGDFEDSDIENPDAGFARNGDKLDIFGGFFMNERVTFTGLLRYPTFDTDRDNVIRLLLTSALFLVSFYRVLYFRVL